MTAVKAAPSSSSSRDSTAASSTDTLALTVFSSNSASDVECEDGQDGATVPLLARDKTAFRPESDEEEKASTSARGPPIRWHRLLSFAGALLVFGLVVGAAATLICTVLRQRHAEVPPVFLPTTLDSVDLANLSSTQQYLRNASNANAGVVPFFEERYKLVPRRLSSTFANTTKCDTRSAPPSHLAQAQPSRPSTSSSAIHTPTRPSLDASFPAADTRFAQIPHWLALPRIELSEPASTPSSTNRPSLIVHPHSELFKAPQVEQDTRAEEWRSSVVPSFNSLAIESRLPNIPVTAQTALYLNDDFFLMRNLAFTDLDSPLTGPVFRMQRNLLVGGVAPGTSTDDSDGEWKGLGYSNWLLDQRFGEQKRPYLAHVAKTVSMPLLREVQQVFHKEVSATAEARFRGKAPNEVQPLFLLTMYIIERHREALLWSFLVARSDVDQSGTYSDSERRAVLVDLGLRPTDAPPFPFIHVPRPRRDTIHAMAVDHATLGLPNPLETTTDFSSHDGYPFLGLEPNMPFVYPSKEWPVAPRSAAPSSDPICVLDVKSCFGDEFASLDDGEVNVSHVFERVAFEQKHCGDCLIALLVGKSGARGLEAFLPEGEDEAMAVANMPVVTLPGPIETRWQEVNYGAPIDGPGTIR